MQYKIATQPTEMNIKDSFTTDFVHLFWTIMKFELLDGKLVSIINLSIMVVLRKCKLMIMLKHS